MGPQAPITSPQSWRNRSACERMRASASGSGASLATKAIILLGRPGTQTARLASTAAQADQRRPQVLGVSVVEIPDPRRGFHTAVHILDQIEEKSWLARELARLRETADALLRGASSDSSKGGVPVRLHLSLSAIAPTEAPAATETLVEALSDREQDVLRAIASGQANKDIARTLHISLATTRNHVQHILKKLDVHTKLEAMALVTRNGWNLPADATDGRPQSPGVLAFP